MLISMTSPQQSLPIGKSGPSRLSVTGSVFLDLLRFSAAVVVAIGHFSDGYATRWPNLEGSAADAVSVFFVLSGFVIRMITVGGRVSARQYTVDRVSRIYSVLIPSMLFSLLVTALVQAFPGHSLLEMHYTLADAAKQIFANLTLSSQIWGMDIPVGFNQVFWSLGYECAYYVLFGVAIFIRGWKRVVALVLLCLFYGPPILSLLPLWLLGCALYEAYQYLRNRPNPIRTLTLIYAVMGVAALVLLLAAMHFRSLLHSPALHAQLHHLRSYLPAHLHLLRRSRPRFYYVGVPAAFVMLYGLLLCDRIRLDKNDAIVRTIRTIADGTFALYLIHPALFALAGAYIPYDRSSNLQACLVLFVSIVLGVAAEAPMNWIKQRMRERLLPQRGKPVLNQT
ncbi:acyltransferase family protein [Terriglobus tenax]|uniref:acyltransferase family protein n=1 Tax=Terriglobus tenax TaxID=1111115 RepID=UPI0021DF82D1|nr:acyltransferase [Terriglobus tenax]